LAARAKKETSTGAFMGGLLGDNPSFYGRSPCERSCQYRQKG
jgi:hypothetical protein